MLSDVVHWIREATGRARAERLRAAERDPWRRLDLEPPLRAFGPGALHDFARYLDRESRVEATSPRAAAQWLLGCRYADDHALLGEHDLWQHPCTFEVVRAGDCEDHSLWAWRKLVEAGYHADFVVGVRHREDGRSGRHAWVLFRERGEDFLLDGVERSVDTIIRALPLVRASYEPQVGVTHEGRRFAFAGLYRTEWGARLALPRTRR